MKLLETVEDTFALRKKASKIEEGGRVEPRGLFAREEKREMKRRCEEEGRGEEKKGKRANEKPVCPPATSRGKIDARRSGK